VSNAPVVAVDRFPVILHAPDGTVTREVRVVMTKPQDGVGELIAWSAPDREVLRTSFKLDDSDIRSKQVDWTLATDAGVVIIQPQHGCGCGNRLKYWTPPEFQPYKMGRLR
jgi:hypothetical protein